MFFGAGEFRPGTAAGDSLIAHEVGHVAAGDSAQGAVHLWGRNKKAQRSASLPPGVLKITLEEPTSAFVVDANTGLVPANAQRRRLEKGTKLGVRHDGTTYKEALGPKRKPFDHVLCEEGKNLVAVSREVLRGSNPHLDRLDEATGYAGAATGLGGDISDGVGAGNLLAARGQATSDASDIRGDVARDDRGEVVYGDLSEKEQGVYDKANLYDPNFEAGAGSVAAVGDIFSQIDGWKSLLTDWRSMSKKQRADLAVNNIGGFVKSFASFNQFGAQAQIAAAGDDYGVEGTATATATFGKRTVKVADGKGGLANASEDYQATEWESVGIASGMFASGAEALTSLKDMVVDVINWAKHISNREEHGNLVRESVNVVHSFGKAVKAALGTAFKVLDFFQGTAGGAMASFAPGIGLALNAVEVLKRGLDIYRAKKDATDVKDHKSSAKSELQSTWGEVDKLDRKKILAKKVALEQRLQSSASEDDRQKTEQQLLQIEDYLLDADLARTADKRRNRAILHIVKASQAIVGDICTLAGQPHAGLALKLSGTATGLGAIGVRKFKQLGRDKGWWKSSKTTDNKNARYGEIAERLYDETISIIAASKALLPPSLVLATPRHWEAALKAQADLSDPGAIAVQTRYARLKGRVKASGCSWREYMSETHPSKKFGMLLVGQKRRE